MHVALMPGLNSVRLGLRGIKRQHRFERLQLYSGQVSRSRTCHLDYPLSGSSSKYEGAAGPGVDLRVVSSRPGWYLNPTKRSTQLIFLAATDSFDDKHLSPVWECRLHELAPKVNG